MPDSTMMPLRLAAALLLLALGAPAAAPVAAQSADEAAADLPVRVHLFEDAAPRTFTIRLLDGQPRATLHAGLAAGTADAPLLELDGGDALTVRRRGDELRVDGPGGRFYAQALRLAPAHDADEAAAAWRVSVDEGRRRPDARTYAGALALAPSREDGRALRLVNTVGLEPYVASVVASEYGLGDLEGTKAQAVAARTYVLHTLRDQGADHVLPDHVGAQVYRGAGQVSAQSRRAARGTRGEVAAYDGALIQAVYHASSGGHTAGNDDVWRASRAVPYLRARPDPYDGESSPHRGWQASLDRSRLLARLSREYGAGVRGFQIAERSDDGRVAEVELLRRGTNERISGNAFRLFANRQARGYGLRSTLFEAERQGNRYVFEGNGYGHGVGMSQHGAHAMAQRGHSYREILAFYYPGTALARLDGRRRSAGLPTLADVTPLPAPPGETDRPPSVAEREDEQDEPLQTPAPPARERIGW